MSAALQAGMRPITLLPFCLVVASCSAATGYPRGGGQAETTPALSPRTAALVWVTSEDGEPVTYRLAEDGTELASETGVRVAAAGTEWAWEETRVPVVTTPCEDGDGGVEREADEGRATRLRLVPADDAVEPQALTAPELDGETNEVDHAVRPIASLGPYVFFEEATYAYSCGVHGSSAVSFVVWDVEHGREVNLLGEIADPEALVDAGLVQLKADAEAAAGDFPEEAPSLTEIVPTVDADGVLGARAQVTLGTCYACGDGAWSSYTRSTQVSAPLPDRLAELGTPPRAVAVFARRHPELAVGGYSAPR